MNYGPTAGKIDNKGEYELGRGYTVPCFQTYSCYTLSLLQENESQNTKVEVFKQMATLLSIFYLQSIMGDNIWLTDKL